MILKRVRIISCIDDDEHYKQFIGQEFDVLNFDEKFVSYKLQIPPYSSSEQDYSYWYDEEIEVLEWEE